MNDSENFLFLSYEAFSSVKIENKLNLQCAFDSCQYTIRHVSLLKIPDLFRLLATVSKSLN